jgi:hypothetical protein
MPEERWLQASCKQCSAASSGNRISCTAQPLYSSCPTCLTQPHLCAVLAGERPPTPDAPPLPDAEGHHAALVLLQRLLRGRAVQNEMYAGKTARLQLVRELRLGLEGTAGGRFVIPGLYTSTCTYKCCA